MKEEIKKVSEILDVNRTDKLFDSSIVSSQANSRKVYTVDSLRAAKVALGFGNLHVNTSRIKLNAIRMLGFMDNLRKVKQAVGRRIRNVKKYGR